MPATGNGPNLARARERPDFLLDHVNLQRKSPSTGKGGRASGRCACFLLNLPFGAERMNLMITGHHVDVSQPLRDYVENKLDRVVRHFDRIIDIAVVLGVEKPSEKDRRQRAEVNLRLRGNVIHVEHFAEDLYAAIDGLVDKLDRQVLRYKDKVQGHQHEALKHVSQDFL
jgi:putative sigma-54 modulation protein